jgi:cold shock CspA family protein
LVTREEDREPSRGLLSSAVVKTSAMTKRGPARSGKASGPHLLRGKPVTGRVAKLFIGQGHGFIRVTNKGEVFFHRADVQEGTAFNDLRIGDAVTLELFEDAVSGARALRVARSKRSR